MELIRNHILSLQEELNYRESVDKHKKSLETTLWGLEEQLKYPENQNPQDQEEINTQINICKSKIINCNKVLDSHTKKLISITENFKLRELLSK